MDQKRFVFTPAKRGRSAANPIDRNRLAAVVAGLLFNGKVSKPADFDGQNGKPTRSTISNAFGGFNAIGRWCEGYANWLKNRPNSVELVAAYIEESGNALPEPKNRPGSGGSSNDWAILA